jgi:signal transduction histidine kinase
LERVFEPFYRLEVSRNRESGGTGLGLTIARNLARAHGGELSLHNLGEGGLEAVLTLPRDSVEEPRPSRDASPAHTENVSRNVAAAPRVAR